MADLAGAERLLGHSVALTLPADANGVMVAVSSGGEPAATRVAWIDWRAPAITARLACPPQRPSRLRPVVATDVRIAQAGVDDRVIAMRAVDGIEAVRLVVAEEAQPEPVAVVGGVAAIRVPEATFVVAVDALSQAGEPVGRLDAAGIGLLRLADGRITGRLGVTHGLAAGFGAGFWVDDAERAAIEAGFPPTLPEWVPDGLEPTRFHIEPDVAYPAAPPSIVVAWGAEPRRILLRQTPGVLASPDPGGARSRDVAVDGWPGRVMSRGRFATLIWECDDRAFGVQVQGFDDPERIAERVAMSM